MHLKSEAAVVDIFCGVGGLSHGFRRAGFNVIAGIDVDPDCAHAYEQNNNAKFIRRPIEDVKASDIQALYPKTFQKVLIGCAPCQPFSAYVAERRKRSGGRWRLLEDFASLIGKVQPDVVTMENVPRLVTFDGGKLLKAFVAALDEQDYHVWSGVVDCGEFGVPQTRNRLVLLASRHGPLRLVPSREKSPTVRDAIGHLPRLEAGQIDERDRLHRAARLSRLNLRRIRASRPGGTWQDWPQALRADCHKRRSGQWYRNVYGRMKWEEAAPTITTGCFGYGRGRFGHPDQDRAISLREAALLQTFPQDYDFVPLNEPVRFSVVGRHIGNAVPVRLAEAIAATIADHLGEFDA